MLNPKPAFLVACALGALALLASCATQNAQPALPTTAQAAPASSMAAAGNSACKVDATKICNAVKNLPVRFGTGLSGNLTYQTQNSLATEWEVWHVQIPKGSRFDVQCEINTSIRRVIYATELRGSPALTADDAAWLHKAGLCTGETQKISDKDLAAHVVAGEAP